MSETAVFAGGCFWGVQGVFQHVKGVSNAVSGYAGGTPASAHYEMVSGGRTGHAVGLPRRVRWDTENPDPLHRPTLARRTEPDGDRTRETMRP